MQHYSSYNEKELLQKIAEGDEHSFRLIYDRYRPKIYSYALRLTEDESMSDDVIQTVFLSVWLNRSKLPEVVNFNAWLNRTAKNTVYNAFKAKTLRRDLAINMIALTPVSVEDPYTWLDDKENELWLQDALKQLTPAQREVYQLSRKQGMTAAEIAKQLNIAEGTAKKHLSNSLQALRIYIEKHNMILAIIAAETVVNCL